MFNVLHDGLNLGPNVFCAAIGRTMYEQCLPDQSADLIFSSIVAMNLSKSPYRPKDVPRSFEPSEEEKTDYKAQAALDWKTFLVMRGRELRPGGCLVVLNIGATKHGETIIHIKGGNATLGYVLRTLLDDEIITKNEFMDSYDYHIKTLYRTEEDHALPFTENDKEILETGLELVSTRSFVHNLHHPSFEITEKDESTKKVYADRIIAGIKPWLYNTIYDGLSSNRSHEERTHLVDTYFTRLWKFAFENNDQIPRIPLVELVARKRQQENI